MQIAPTARENKWPGDADGYTLVESILAVMILGISLGACVLSFDMAMRTLGTSRNQMVAVHYARLEMENLRTNNFTNATLNAGTYTITRTSYTGYYNVSTVDTNTVDVTVGIAYKNRLRSGYLTNTLTTSLARTLHY